MIVSKQMISLLTIMRNVSILLLLFLSSLFAGASESLELWPQGAPGEKNDIGVEQDMTKPEDGFVDGKRVIRLGNVSAPTITLYPASDSENTGAAMIVCPGGGYRILAMDLEGTEVCQWLNSIGVNAVLLKYRVPARKGLERYSASLQDAQRALSVVRSHAAEWNVDPKRIGIMGFSAGGHLSAAASTCFVKRSYKPIDSVDQNQLPSGFCYADLSCLFGSTKWAGHVTGIDRDLRHAAYIFFSRPKTILCMLKAAFIIIWRSNRPAFERRCIFSPQVDMGTACGVVTPLQNRGLNLRKGGCVDWVF